MSARLLKVYNSLPPEAQQMFVEKHLATLLDAVPKDKSKKVMVAATRLQNKYKAAPKLDLQAKKRQIGELLEELARDAKCSIVKERSNRDELLFEIVYGLVGWLNVIWSVVYEYNVQFATAHTCLVFVSDALTQLSETSALGGCKCSILNLPVEVQLKDRNGKLLKRFAVLGPQNVDRILLWIWRDLFVSLSSTGSEKDKAKIPDFLKELREVLGLRALERLLSGGQPTEYDDDWEDAEDEDEDLLYDEDPCDEDDLESNSEDSHSRCQCKLHASYWTERINKERTSLRDCVVDQLLAVFKKAPSLRLYNSLMGTTTIPGRIEVEVSQVLQEVAGDSPDNLVAAIEIYIAMNSCNRVVSLLDKYMYLLRPRDIHALRSAVCFLSVRPEHRSRSLAILENELEDYLQTLHATIRSCFSHIDEEPNRAELSAILKLKASTQARKSRIEQWAEKVTTSSGNLVGPMTFAAVMMGLPILPGVEEGDDLDMLSYLDLDQNDPDMDDIRDEYRPNLKARFDNWVEVGSGLTGGPVVLVKFYAKVLEKMPYIQGQDIVNEMTNRLNERPSKAHVVDALRSLATFAKIQRKKIRLAIEKRQKNAAVANSRAASSNANQAKPNGKTSGNANTSGNPPSQSTLAPSSLNFTFTPPSTPASFPTFPGGMEDVD